MSVVVKTDVGSMISNSSVKVDSVVQQLNTGPQKPHQHQVFGLLLTLKPTHGKISTEATVVPGDYLPDADTEEAMPLDLSISTTIKKLLCILKPETELEH